MLQHLHAGDHIILVRYFGGMGFGCDLAVLELDTLLQGVQAGDAEGLLAHVDAGYPGTTAGHALGENAATTADI